MPHLIDPDQSVLVIIDVQADFLARVEDETEDCLLEASRLLQRVLASVLRVARGLGRPATGVDRSRRRCGGAAQVRL